MTNRILSFFGLSLILFQMFLTFPVAVWVSNKNNFDAGLTDSFGIFVCVGLILLCVSGLIAFLIPKKASTITAPALAVIAVLVFLQQNVLSWDYGILDGITLNFEQNNVLGLIDVLVWVLGLTSLLLFRKKISKATQNIVLGLTLTLCATTGLNIFNYGEFEKQYSLTEIEKYDFSKNENVIVFMLDAFQHDHLEQILHEDPKLKEELSGFTLYENNLASFAKTLPSIALFLTGKRYQKEEPITEFFDKAYDNSLMTDYQKNGWNVGLYPETTIFPGVIKAIKNDPSVMDNLVGGTSLAQKIKVYSKSLDLSLFRVVPHHLKPLIFNEGNFVVGDKIVPRSKSAETSEVFIYDNKRQHHGVAFDRQLKEQGQIVLDEPAFRYYHFVMPHAPISLSRDIQKIKHSNDFGNLIDYSYASLKLMTSYLQSLKDLGVYDNAGIIILSDHGLSMKNNLQYNPGSKAYDELERYGFQRNSGKSILLIKKPGDSFALKRSSKPTSAIDIAPTLASMSSLPVNKYEGQPVETLDEDEDRERIFSFYQFTTWDSKYLPEFSVFKVNGDVRSDNAWQNAGSLKKNIRVDENPLYSLGDVVSYGSDIKTDTDFQNSFIETSKYGMSPNFLIAKDGNFQIDLEFAEAPDMNSDLLLQFEIYSGAETVRQLTVNGSTISQLMKPTKRRLNEGIRIAPEIHKGQKDIQISFSTPEGQPSTRLNFSTLKLTKIED